ncbi:MAG: TraG/TraD/VirD4 family protein, partial [Cohaesibacter sp.]|nr:TraG/TraD/VirD4 family protein [Cohaesibacter sp.]
VCAILPQEHAILTGPHYALHQQGFREAQYSGRGGRLVNIVDEATNSPQKKAIEAVTTERAFKTASKYAAQTFVDFERVLGVKEAAILADNCAVKQYLSFNEADARKVSGQMGEEISLQQSVNIDPEKLEIRRSISTTKQAVMTPGELMNLDPVYQVIHLKGFGWLVCRKLFQNQLAPTCFYLGTNRWEGNPLPPDPKVELPVYQGGAA